MGSRTEYSIFGGWILRGTRGSYTSFVWSPTASQQQHFPRDTKNCIPTQVDFEIEFWFHKIRNSKIILSLNIRLNNTNINRELRVCCEHVYRYVIIQCILAYYSILYSLQYTIAHYSLVNFFVLNLCQCLMFYVHTIELIKYSFFYTFLQNNCVQHIYCTLEK